MGTVWIQADNLFSWELLLFYVQRKNVTDGKMDWKKKQNREKQKQIRHDYSKLLEKQPLQQNLSYDVVFLYFFTVAWWFHHHWVSHCLENNPPLVLSRQEHSQSRLGPLTSACCLLRALAAGNPHKQRRTRFTLLASTVWSGKPTKPTKSAS